MSKMSQNTFINIPYDQGRGGDSIETTHNPNGLPGRCLVHFKINNLQTGVYQISEFNNHSNKHDIWGVNLPDFGENWIIMVQENMLVQGWIISSLPPRIFHHISHSSLPSSAQKLSKEVLPHTSRPHSPPHQLITKLGLIDKTRSTTYSMKINNTIYLNPVW